MTLIYYWIGAITFWTIIVLTSLILCTYVLILVWSIRARFWAYQIWERYKAPKIIEEIKSNNTPEGSYRLIRHYLNVFTNPTYKYYRHSMQLFRNYYIRKLSKILKEYNNN